MDNRTTGWGVLAWIGLAALSATPLAALIASRAPTLISVILGLLAIPLVLKGRTTLRLDVTSMALMIALALALIFASVLAEVGFSNAIGQGLEICGLLLAAGLGGALVWNHECFNAAPARRAIITLYGTSLALLVIELAAGFPIYRSLRGIPATELVDPWTFDRTAVVFSVLLWPSLACLRDQWASLASILFSGTMLAAALMTESQTVPLTVAASFLVYWIARFAPRLVASLGALISAAYLLTAPWLFVGLYQPALALFREWTQASAGARLEIWRVTGEFAQQRPITGWGPDAIRSMENIFSEDEPFMTAAEHSTAHHPHNFALQAWLDLGLLGVLAITALILLTFWRISRLPPILAAAGLAMLAATLIAGSLSPGLWQAWWLATIGLAVCQFIIATRDDQPFAIRQVGSTEARSQELEGHGNLA